MTLEMRKSQTDVEFQENEVATRHGLYFSSTSVRSGKGLQLPIKACRGGVEVAGWTVDRKTRVYTAFTVGPLMARRLKTSSNDPVPVSG